MKGKPLFLVVDDEEIVRESLASWLAEDGYQVEVAPDGKAAVTKLAEKPYAVLLLDLKMPGMDGLAVLTEARKLQPDAAAIIMTAYATVDTAVAAMKQGAHDYLVKPFEPEELSALVEKLVQQQALRREHPVSRRALHRPVAFQGMVTKSPKMEVVFEQARAAAKSGFPVLLLGEGGTGKAHLARAIHAESPRKDAPFVEVTCAALTEALLESELFGHEKGASAGAGTGSRGKLELAAGGSLFLGEIADISPRLRVELVRVLDAHETRRGAGLPGARPDARIIAATARDLKGAAESGPSREDVFQRPDVIRIAVPPLRERKEDIPVLAEYFLTPLRAATGKTLEGVSGEALELLKAYDWPGNVQELRTVLERGAARARGTILTPMDLEIALPGSPSAGRSEPGDSLKEVERRHIAATLRQHNWNISRTARALEIDRVTLYNKIKRYQIREDD